MKNISEKFTGAILGLAVALAALAAFAPAAKAESFQTTNTLAYGISFFGYPTNSPNTNGLGVANGHKISIANVREAGFYCGGYNITNQGPTANLVFKLVFSSADSPPVYDGTNLQWSIVTPTTITVPVTNIGPFYFTTNLDQYALQGANWVGIYQLTNTATGVAITNLDVGINKKITPVRLQ